MTDLTRIRELLAKAEKGSVSYWFNPILKKQITLQFNRQRKFLWWKWVTMDWEWLTPVQFAALKAEFPDKFNGEE